MKRRKKRSRLYYLLLMFAAAAIALSSVYLREPPDGALHQLKDELRDLAARPLSTFKDAHDSFLNWLQSLLNASELKAENEKLREELKMARRLVLEAEAVKRENEQLKKILEIYKPLKEKSVVAEIIAVNQELSGKFYLINKGRMHGIKPNLPVITADGVFGKIYSAGNNSAVVMPANHPLSAISARIAETGEQGIVEGSPEGKLYLKLIPRESQAAIGMIVVTSGLGGVYPKNLLLGTIKSIKEDPNRLDLDIEVGPAVNYETSEYVIVLLRVTDE